MEEKMGTKKYYVTTPLYYGTGRPHLGSLYSTVLADVVARWHKLNGCEVFFLTGTDEHGQKIAEAAEKAGKKPKEFVDAFVEDYKKVWKDYHIDYTKFIRTTDEEHKKAVHKLINKLLAKGDVYKDEYKGWYCTPCETFVPGPLRYDLSGKSLRVSGGDDKGPVCPSCGRETVCISETCYFFKLSAYQEKILKFFKDHPDFVYPKERLNEVISFVESGLKDLCISRSTVKWGIPFPGEEEQVVYVWADALTNYIAALGYGDSESAAEFEKWWPADLHILGKDIVRFHAVYWIAFLMAADLQLPKHMLVHGWITVDGQKMSKSLKNAVDPEQLLRLYGADSVRYYLVSRFSITQDASFSVGDLEKVITQDLANELGNLLNRVVVLANKHGVEKIAPREQWSAATTDLLKSYDVMLGLVGDYIKKCSFHMACAEVKKYIAQVNSYVHVREPWFLANKDPEAFVETLAAVGSSLYAVAHLLWPVMPKKMEELLEALGKKLILGEGIDNLGAWRQEFAFNKGLSLFEKVEGRFDEVEKEEPKNTVEEIDITDFAKIHLVVGTIKEAELVEKSAKLLKLQVDCGEYGMRQILAGIKQWYRPEDLVGEQGIFVVNLKPRKLMGLESEGMMLFVEGIERLERVHPAGKAPEGKRVR